MQFLSASCGDDAELRREVESLLGQPSAPLDAWVDSGGFLQTNAGVSSNTGRRIGAYQLKHELGRGGMGTVWLAERADGRFEQQVAIKLLKRGTDTEEVLRRFRAERQILARLDHPGIARLYDGGETDDGLPFFVLEYIAGGEPLTDFATHHSLSIPDRLALFRKVCAAVQFAHQNLVVHRDLKPANVLVTPEAEPKLLDFGIARLLEPDDIGSGSSLLMTAVDSRRLTPAYASPEQVRGNPITTASDIYTLGVLLYELLTGKSPHQFATAHPSPTELLRVIGEQIARPPSVIAAPGMRRQLRGDLDNIVLRAMAPDAARRYSSASTLADDLARFTAGRTVRARPDTIGYRSAKFIQRNKVGVAAGALIVVALAGGIAATAWQARRAQRRFDEVRGLTNSYLFEIHDAIRDLPGSTTARQLIVTRALEYLDRLAADSSGDDALQLELAGAYLKVGDVQGRPYAANLGDSAGALRSYLKAAEIAAPLAAAEHGTTSLARAVLGQAYENAGRVEIRLRRWQDAAESHRRAIAIDQDLLRSDSAHAAQWQRSLFANDIGLGDSVVSANRFQPAAGYQHVALEHYRAALPICEALVAAHPQDASDRWRLAKTCSRIATELSEIGAAENDRAAFDESLRFHLRALAIDEAAVAAEPGNSGVRRTLADELIALAYLRAFSHDDLPAGVEECRRAEQIMGDLAAADPANTEARQDLSSVHFVTARVLQAEGERTGAAASYRSCLHILEPLVVAHPDNIETAFDLTRAREGLAQVEQSARDAGALN